VPNYAYISLYAIYYTIIKIKGEAWRGAERSREERSGLAISHITIRGLVWKGQERLG